MTSRVGASELAKTEKLNETNFHAWKRRIVLALTLEKLIYVINQPFPTLGDKPTNEEIKAYESFTSDDLMAKTTMLAFMEDDQIRVFEDYPIAKEMFDTITSKYNFMTTMHVQLLQEQYNSYRMKESDDVMDHVNKMLVMAKDLAMMGDIISDNMQISTILNNLPPSWDMAVTALSVQFDNLTLEKLPLQLVLQQQRLTKRNRAELMIVQEKPVGSHVPVKPKQFKNRNDGKFKGNFVSTKKSQGTVVKCYRCGKPGHIRKNCRTRFTNIKDNKGQDNYNRRKPQDEQSGNEPTGDQFGNEPTGGQFGNEPTEQESSEEQVQGYVNHGLVICNVGCLFFLFVSVTEEGTSLISKAYLQIPVLDSCKGGLILSLTSTRFQRVIEHGDDTLEMYVGKFKVISDDLAAIGKSVGDKEKAFWLLQGLGKGYGPFVMAMLKPPVPSYKEMVSFLQSLEDGGQSGDDLAFLLGDLSFERQRCPFRDQHHYLTTTTGVGSLCSQQLPTERNWNSPKKTAMGKLDGFTSMILRCSMGLGSF
ncbi:Retrovirus-related Pol polyprotein from transposon TNT 1-94 [Nymphaea thermarum]|nr:Retrovirus-related Pol polyprotein from transposon TNT 1-94 [Nymphaea thermarum]